MIKMQQSKMQKSLLNILENFIQNDEDYYLRQKKGFIYQQLQFLYH